MNVLVVNPGSSSLKLSVLDGADTTLADCELPSGSAAADRDGLDRFVAAAPPVSAAGVRVVHGGPELRAPIRVDDAILERLDAVAALAPLHDARAVATIRALRSVHPDCAVVACFDTGFHTTMSAEATTYAVPWQWTTGLGIRKLGFHGFSHAYASRRAAELLGHPITELRTVTGHLGSGASLAAVAAGVSVDTTMGFTPSDGLVMATRSGSVDPGALLHVMRRLDLAPVDLELSLERDSGLLALSGRTADMREVIAAADAGDSRARLALGVSVHRLRAGIAAMTAAMGGIDALVFTGGIGEHSARVRHDTCAGLAFLGVALDGDRNADPPAGDVDLSSGDSRVRVLRVHAREDVEIARGVRSLLASG